MTDPTPSPGTVLLGRFALEDLIELDEDVAVWRAHDRTLRRSVSIRTVADDDPRAQALLDAAREAAPIVDPRILRVLDTASDQGVTFSVHEWVRGVSLEDLARPGSLDPVEAATIMRDVADAIADAHRVGVSHGGLSPGKVLRRDNGGIRVTGLGVDRALHPRPHSYLDPRTEDVRELGALLFTALTGRPPTGDDEDVSPRRIRAGVPRALDDLCVTLLTRSSLSARQVRDRLDEFLAGWEQHRPARADDSYPPLPTAPAPEAFSSARTTEPPHWLRLAGLIAAGVFLLVAVAVALSANLPKALDPAPATTSPTTGDTSATPGPQVLPIAAIKDFDPLASGRDKTEHPDEVGFAIDGDPTTAWTTQVYYRNPRLGLLKDGVGLLLDLGQEERVGSVRLTLIGTPTDLSILAAPGATTAPSEPAGYQTVAQVTGAGTAVDLTFDQPVTTRYLVVWLTSLPPVKGGYQGAVAEIQVLS